MLRQKQIFQILYKLFMMLKSLKGQNLQEDQFQLSQHNNILTNRVKYMLPNVHCK